MISPLLKITTLALICSISFAGITFAVSGPEFDNKRIYRFDVCDHTKPTEFPPAFKSYFNCTKLVFLNNGNYACNNDPCPILGSSRAYRTCVWQANTMDPTFPDAGTSGIGYTLTPCRQCMTENCNGRYYWDGEVCSGNMVTKNYGSTWICSDPSCQGEMKMQSDGTYTCIKSTSPQPSSDSSLFPWVMVGLLSVAVLYLAHQKRIQEKQNQLNTHF